MRTLVATPGDPLSAAVRVDYIPARRNPDEVVVETVLLGLCGSDRELLHRHSAESNTELVIGHEALGRVKIAPPTSDFAIGDMVFGMIRRPCAEGCAGCRLGRLDLCSSRPIVERGIHHADGFGSTEWTSPPEYLVRLPKQLGEHGVLAEPLTSVVKAGDRLETASHSIPTFSRDHLIVAGAGTIGLLVAWFIGRQFRRVTLIEISPTTASIAAARLLPNVTLHRSWDTGASAANVVIDATGSANAVKQGLRLLRHAGIQILLGIYGEPDGSHLSDLLSTLVLADITTIATINASRAHHEAAATALLEAPSGFLDTFITNRLSPEQWPAWASGDLARGLKTVVDFRR